MAKMTLDDVLNDDDDLLDVKPSTSTASTEDQRMVQGFEDINTFMDINKRRPGDCETPSVSERSMKIRLTGLMNNADARSLLIPYDRHGLLPADNTEPQCLDDILNDDELLSTPSDDIFEFRLAPKPTLSKTDKIAEREPCADFEQFQPLFDEVADELKRNRRKARPFKGEQDIDAGQFYILNGMMAYIAEIRDRHKRSNRSNARLRVIFDNGTESGNLLRSFSRALYKDEQGRRITDPHAGPLFEETPNDGDIASGLIYVLKSLSDDPAVRKLDGLLHKIGFTSGKIEARIQNAKDDPTFLMAPVQPIASYTLYNINKVKLEYLLHKVFSEARLDIEIIDRFGKKVRPREWFLVPADSIAEAISRLKDGTIIDYQFDPQSGALKNTT